MNICIMKIGDYYEVYKLWSSTEGMGLRSLDDTEAGIDKFIKRNPYTNFICRVENRLAGAILCGHDGRRAYIYHAVVDPGFRNKGIGKKLVESVISSLDKQGIKKVCLVVYSNNSLGNGFWESLGFKSRKDLNYRDRVIDIHNL